MAAVAIPGASFTVQVGLTQYEDQVVDGTVVVTPTVTRTKTLGDVAYTQVDYTGSITLSFLYDDNTGLYDALVTAASTGVSVAVTVVGDTGTWTGAAMYVNGDVSTSFNATDVSMVSVTFIGELAFA